MGRESGQCAHHSIQVLAKSFDGLLEQNRASGHIQLHMTDMYVGLYQPIVKIGTTLMMPCPQPDLSISL